MGKIVIDYDSQRLEAAREIADLVASTAGPYGQNVHHFSHDYPVMYRDGLKVIEKYNPNSTLGLGIKLLMAGAAGRTVRNAGDGSTTTTVLLRWIVENATEAIRLAEENKRPVSRRGIANGIRKAGAACVKLLESADRIDIKTEKGQERLRQVATLAGSNDPEIGNAVADTIIAVGTDGYVITEYDPKIAAIETETRGGYRMPFGVISTSMLGHRSSITLENAFVAIVKDALNTNEQISKILMAWKGYCDADEKMYPLVVLCPAIAADAQNIMLNRRGKPGPNGEPGQLLPWFVVRVPAGNEVWEDLFAVTGAADLSGKSVQYFTAKNGALVSNVVLSEKETVIHINDESLQKSGLVNRLSEVLKVAGDDEAPAIESRIARLEGRVGVIKIPVSTSAKRAWTGEVFEDAYRAAISAVKHGIAPGAGRTLCRLSMQLPWDGPVSEQVGIKAVYLALPQVTASLLRNGGVPNSIVDTIIGWAQANDVQWSTILLNDENLANLHDENGWINAIVDGRDAGVVDSAEVLKSAILAATGEAADWVETLNAIVE